MKTDFLRAACALAAMAALFIGGSVQAQDVHLASTGELNNVYARLADLESRLAAGNVAGGGGCGGNDSVCDDCCNYGCKSGCVVGAEALFLKSYHSEGGFGNFNFDEGFRFWAGYQRDDGLGVRIRAFDFDQRSDDDAFVDIVHVDAEVYDSFELSCNWDLILGGGIRYMDMDEEDEDGDDAFFNGAGPVVTAELYRHVNDRLAIYGIVRDSILVGNDDEGGLEDVTTNIFEIQIGTQVHREWNGAYLFGRVAWEAQYYTDNLEDDSEGLSLMGAVFSAGIIR